jgi:hypothetical protein
MCSIVSMRSRLGRVTFAITTGLVPGNVRIGRAIAHGESAQEASVDHRGARLIATLLAHE